MKRKVKYQALSPDGLPIDQKFYVSEDAAMKALWSWVKRFQMQSYYSTASGNRIPFGSNGAEIITHCSIEEMP